MEDVIKLIDKTTDIKSLKISKFDWDVVVGRTYKIPYQVVRIEGYIHTMGGKWGINDLWMYPRREEPSYENLIEFNGNGGVCWGIKYDPHYYVKTKWDETECYSIGGAMITRNGKDFYFCKGGIDEARYRISLLDDHPLELNSYEFDKKMIGRKIWWRSEPGIITMWIGDGQACGRTDGGVQPPCPRCRHDAPA